MKMILRSLGVCMLLTLAMLALSCMRKSAAPLTNMQMSTDTAPASAAVPRAADVKSDAAKPAMDTNPATAPAAPITNPNDEIKAGAVPLQPGSPIQTPALTGTVTAPN